MTSPFAYSKAQATTVLSLEELRGECLCQGKYWSASGHARERTTGPDNVYMAVLERRSAVLAVLKTKEVITVKSPSSSYVYNIRYIFLY